MKLFFCILMWYKCFVPASDTGSVKHASPELHGYVKYMDQFSFIDSPDNNTFTSLIHNRLNLKWSPNHLLFRLEVRNRIFSGDQLKLNRSFMRIASADDGALNLTKIWIDESGLGAVSTIDRALINYHYKQWDVCIGRQRINWGVNMVWNPNDIFNVYNFFDFDYEERPGSDAIRIQYMWKGFSSIEIAAKKGAGDHDYTAAMLLKGNKKGYDYQILSGLSEKDLLFGTGWAGNLKNAGFKGEFTYFHPYKNMTDTNGVVSGCLSIDYSFKEAWYFNFSTYMNTQGNTRMNFLNTQAFFDISAKQLLPFRYAGFIQLSKQINPLLSAGLSHIYSPTNNTWIVVPNVQYSVASNWEITLLGQSFFTDVNKVYRSLGNSIFLRLKWIF